jgi:hypothetical protein
MAGQREAVCSRPRPISWRSRASRAAAPPHMGGPLSRGALPESLSGDRQGGGLPHVRSSAGVPVCALVRTDAPSAWGRARGQAPKPRSGAPQAQGLTARTRSTPSSFGRTRAGHHPSCPGPGVRAKPEFKAQARFRHAAATAASPHIRSARQAPAPIIPRAPGHRAGKSGTILFDGMSQPGGTCGHHSPVSGVPVATRPAGWG